VEARRSVGFRELLPVADDFVKRNLVGSRRSSKRGRVLQLCSLRQRTQKVSSRRSEWNLQPPSLADDPKEFNMLSGGQKLSSKIDIHDWIKVAGFPRVVTMLSKILIQSWILEKSYNSYVVVSITEFPWLDNISNDHISNSSHSPIATHKAQSKRTAVLNNWARCLAF
jgi:hypothetical protein